jgi:hypothetical protein
LQGDQGGRQSACHIECSTIQGGEDGFVPFELGQTSVLPFLYDTPPRSQDRSALLLDALKDVTP